MESLGRCRESLQEDSQLRALEDDSWCREEFGNPEEEERSPLEAATKQRSAECDWDH
jgi:hypothetical protein